MRKGTTLTLLPDLEHAARRLLSSSQVTTPDAQAYDTAGQAMLDAYQTYVFELTAELHAAGERLIAALCESEGIHTAELRAWRRTPYRLTGLFPPALHHQMAPALELALDQAIFPDEPRVNLQYTELGICRPDQGFQLFMAMVWLTQGFRLGAVALRIPEKTKMAVAS